MAVILQSFGYLHESGVPAVVVDGKPQIVLDVRQEWRDPHHDPAMRELTGRDAVIRERVLIQPGAVVFLRQLASAVAALVAAAGDRPVRVAIGCAGGRHRSVVAVDELARLLAQRGIRGEVEHLHIGRPVVRRPARGDR
jgi:UPF0042 nucleotide-binding protein